MDEKINETTTEEVTTPETPMENDELKEAIEAQLSKIRRQSMLLGSQVICKTVLDKIVAAMNKPGKRSLNDYRRLVKDLENFCKIGLSRKINTDGETEPIEEPVENNNTKLMEEANESNTNESNGEPNSSN